MSNNIDGIRREERETKKAVSQTVLKCMADAARVTWMFRMTTGQGLMDLFFLVEHVLGRPVDLAAGI